MNNIIKENIIKEAKQLDNIGDCFGIKITSDKGLFVQVEYSFDGNKEYFIELNDVDAENCYEPCGDYNESADFGNIEMLINKIENYLEYHGINL